MTFVNFGYIFSLKEPKMTKPDVIKAAVQQKQCEKEIWNAAIEAAASKIEGAPLFAQEIRKLKK